MTTKLTEDQQVLLEGCRRGDEAAWIALFRAYSGDVGRFLKGMLRNHSEVDDLVQRVFLQFIASLDRYRGDATLRTWLLRIARNVALHEIRTRSRRERHVKAYAESLGSSVGVNPEGQVAARQRLARLEKLIWSLEPEFREVWVLREVGGCSVAEAAQVMEVPEATIRSRHYRARKKLFNLLEALESSEEASPSTAKWTLIQGGGGS